MKKNWKAKIALLKGRQAELRMKVAILHSPDEGSRR